MNVEIGTEAALFPEKGIYKRNCRCSVLNRRIVEEVVATLAMTPHLHNNLIVGTVQNPFTDIQFL